MSQKTMAEILIETLIAARVKRVYGPGNMHLINGLYDCHRSRVPVRRKAAANYAGLRADHVGGYLLGMILFAPFCECCGVADGE